MQQIDLRGLLEHFSGGMVGCGKARTCEHDLARVGLRSSDELLHIVRWKIRPGDNEQACSGDLTHRSKGGQSVIAHVLSGDGRNDLARGHDAERISVRIRICDRLVANNAAGAWLVLNYNWLAELDLHRICKNAADDVGTPAGTERYDDADRF